MAMTKKEKAAFDAAIKAARVAGALRATESCPPDLAPPSASDGGAKEVCGWDFNMHEEFVYPAWSRATRNGAGRPLSGLATERIGGTRGSIPLYSTQLRAPRGLRHAVEQSAAHKLAAIDGMIEAAVLKQAVDEDLRVETYREVVVAAVAQEREECAKACEAEAVDAEQTGEENDKAYNMALKHAAAAIRGRGAA